MKRNSHASTQLECNINQKSMNIKFLKNNRLFSCTINNGMNFSILLIFGTNQWVDIYVWQILVSALDLQKTHKKNLAPCCNCFKENHEDNSSEVVLKAFEIKMYLQRIRLETMVKKNYFLDIQW